ncbi:MAG: TetR/AcrR family transcriptional regulator [Burkholderiales bacterium]
MPAQKTDLDTIVSRAAELIRKQGYHKTSMAELAEACGLLKGSLYHYFPSKEALAIAVMGRVRDYFEHEVFRWAYADDLSPQERLDRMALETERYFLRGEGGCLMANFALGTIDIVPEFGLIVKRYFQDWIDALSHVLQSKFSPDMARLKAEQAVAEIQGAILLMRVFKDTEYFIRANRKIAADFQGA